MFTEIQKPDASDEEKNEFKKEQEAHWRSVIPMEHMYPWPLQLIIFYIMYFTVHSYTNKTYHVNLLKRCETRYCHVGKRLRYCEPH